MESIKGFSLVNWIFVYMSGVYTTVEYIDTCRRYDFLCICWYIVDGNRQ